MILVDNASAEGVEGWDERLPQTLVLHNPRRLHYAANMNRILQASTARYVLLMNTDVYFAGEERCLTKMVEFMDSHPTCGVGGCRVYHEDGTYAYPARRFQTIGSILCRRFGLRRLLPGTLEHYLYQDREIHDAWQCDWLSGCFLLLRREACRNVGLFDDGFLKYFEDVDMCLAWRGGAGRRCTTGRRTATTWSGGQAGTCSRSTPGSTPAPMGAG